MANSSIAAFADSHLPNLTGSEILGRCLLVLVLIAINAFFVATEFSIVSVRRSRINQLVEAGDVQAVVVQDLQRSLDRLLSTSQLGITLSCLMLGWIAESVMATLVETWIYRLPFLATAKAEVLAHSLALPFTFLLIAYLQIVLGELCPKSVALLYSDQLARVLAAPSKVIVRIFHPFTWVLNQSTRLLLRLVGIEYTGQGWHPQLTSEELQLIIATERESPGLEDEERELLTNVLEFGEVSTEAVMIPRTDIIALPKTATFQDLLNQVAEAGYSRYPVIEDSLDHICGMIYFKHLAEPLAKGQISPESSIAPWIHACQFVPESMPLGELLALMQRNRQPMAIVVDEFGGTAGLVTVEDVIAELIGTSLEFETEEDTEFQIIDDRTYLVQAQMNLEELNESLQFDLPLSDDYQTLGGFVLYEFQKIPKVGEVLHYGDLELTIVSATGPRLNQIRIHRLASPHSSPSDCTDLP